MDSKLTVENKTNSFEQSVKDYVKMNSPKLCILTPCYGGMTFVNYTICLVNTLNVFRSLDFPVKVEFCKNDSLISRARNNLIAKAMSDTAVTHVIFIDNDITWNPVDILKLVLSGKELCGGFYPLKNYNWNDLISKDSSNSNPIQTMLLRKQASQFRDIITDEEMVQYNLVKYNMNLIDNSSLTIDNNMPPIKHLATGFMLIHRQTIEKMIVEYSATKYVDDVGFLANNENDMAYALFDCGVEYGRYMSEDWMFCSRWRKMGGEIFGDVSINLTHTGVEEFKGSFIASVI
jgi:hypothetical protein